MATAAPATPGTNAQEDEGENEEEAQQPEDALCPEVVVNAAKPNADKVLREIGDEAEWSLSSAKPGNSVAELRDDNLDTYWQSDGGQPHLINLQFRRKTAVTQIAFYLDYAQDESYTPKKLSVRSGTTFHDLVEVRTADLREPAGWVLIPLFPPPSESPTEECPFSFGGDDGVLRTFFLQVCVVSMHQNGRDTHVRQAKVFGPRTPLDKHADLTGLGFNAGGPLARFAVLR